jgi:hypothetical protein
MSVFRIRRDERYLVLLHGCGNIEKQDTAQPLPPPISRNHRESIKIPAHTATIDSACEKEWREASCLEGGEKKPASCHEKTLLPSSLHRNFDSSFVIHYATEIKHGLRTCVMFLGGLMAIQATRSMEAVSRPL